MLVCFIVILSVMIDLIERVVDEFLNDWVVGIDSYTFKGSLGMWSFFGGYFYVGIVYRFQCPRAQAFWLVPDIVVVLKHLFTCIYSHSLNYFRIYGAH